MDLHLYYKENKDEINSSIMEIASDLAVARLVDKHQLPFDAFVEPEDPDDPESGTCYKEEYQDEYNRFYDEEYNRLARLMKFDITSPDGIAGERQRFSGNRSQDGLHHDSIRHRKPERRRRIRGGHRRHPRPTPPRHENRGQLHREHRNLRPP